MATSNPSIQRGQIWLVDWSPGRGSEQAGKRPALIIQNEAGNRSENYPNTIVAAVSTKGQPVPFHVSVRKSVRNGLKEDSFVKCEQVMTIRKSRLIGRSWGKIDAADLTKVDQALKLSLALP